MINEQNILTIKYNTIMKNKLNLFVWVLCLLIIASCGTPDPKELAEEAIEVQKEVIMLKIEKEELQQDLIKTYDKKIGTKKIKNPDYGDEEWEEEYIEETYKVVDDWDEHVDLLNNIRDRDKEIFDLELSFYNEYIDAVLSCEDQDEFDEWVEDFEDEVEDLEDEDEFEDLKESLEKERDRTDEKEESYFKYDDE